MMGKLALVTGGCGFIGSHLTEELLRNGWSVRVLDDLSTGSEGNLHAVRRDVDLRVGSVANVPDAREACKGVDSVFHLAAIASVPASVADPVQSHAVTLSGTLGMLMAARDAGVRRFVLASSASVYGNADSVPTREDQPLRPQSPYATAKAAAELYCRNFFDLYGLETVILRYFNVFGPRQPANSGYAAAIPKFVEAARSGGKPVVFGDGRQTRDFVYVGNIVAANLRAAEAGGVAGFAYNIGCGEGITLLELLTALELLCGRRLEPHFRPARDGEVRHSRADISMARQYLGYEPFVSWREGLRRTWEYSPPAVPAAAEMAIAG